MKSLTFTLSKALIKVVMYTLFKWINIFKYLSRYFIYAQWTCGMVVLIIAYAVH